MIDSQEQFLNGEISREQLDDIYTAQGVGAVIGLAVVAGGYVSGEAALPPLARWMNQGRYIRVGPSRVGGREVYRVAGEWLGKVPKPLRDRLGIRKTPSGWKWDWKVGDKL